MHFVSHTCVEMIKQNHAKGLRQLYFSKRSFTRNKSFFKAKSNIFISRISICIHMILEIPSSPLSDAAGQLSKTRESDTDPHFRRRQKKAAWCSHRHLPCTESVSLLLCARHVSSSVCSGVSIRCNVLPPPLVLFEREIMSTRMWWADARVRQCPLSNAAVVVFVMCFPSLASDLPSSHECRRFFLLVGRECVLAGGGGGRRPRRLHVGSPARTAVRCSWPPSAHRRPGASRRLPPRGARRR